MKLNNIEELMQVFRERLTQEEADTLRASLEILVREWPLDAAMTRDTHKSSAYIVLWSEATDLIKSPWTLRIGRDGEYYAETYDREDPTEELEDITTKDPLEVVDFFLHHLSHPDLVIK